MQNQNNFTEKNENDIISKLHTTTTHDINFEPKEGQPDVVCSNKTSCGCPSLGFPPIEFTDETINALRGLGEVLLPVYKRLLSEGYKRVNGRLVKPDERKSTNKDE